MNIKVIQTNEDHKVALERLMTLANASPGSAEYDECQLLALEDYESRSFPMGMPTPLGAIEFAMDQRQLGQAEMVPFLGDIDTVRAVLDGRQALTLEMIRKLCTGLQIPDEILIQDVPVKVAA
ncbi:transcriptional regulator [Verrucomicrobia bacterium LW23]|nr:transcriptional regulator [Verrucomicrobia bacterium LW23]